MYFKVTSQKYVGMRLNPLYEPANEESMYVNVYEPLVVYLTSVQLRKRIVDAYIDLEADCWGTPEEELPLKRRFAKRLLNSSVDEHIAEASLYRVGIVEVYKP